MCGITLRSADLESHFLQELERLERVSRSSQSSASFRGGVMSPSSSSGASAAAAAATTTHQVQKREQDTRWETFHRIRINRANRVRAKARKRRADEAASDLAMMHEAAAAAASAGTPCPICGERLVGSAEALNQHVVQCLRQNGQDPGDEDEPLDVEGDSYEEYEWAGQRRVRASSLLEGGFAGAGMQVCNKATGDEEMEEVVVDGDDTAAFGPSQFSENDIHSAADVTSSSNDDCKSLSIGPSSY